MSQRAKANTNSNSNHNSNTLSNSDNQELSPELLAVFKKIVSEPDLKELVPYLQPMVKKAYTVLANTTDSVKDNEIFADVDDRRKVENILTRDLPQAIENYLAMPLDYRNSKSKKSEGRYTHREILIQSLELLVQALKDIEARNMEVFEQKAAVSQKVIKEKYAVEVTPENQFKGSFNWQAYEKEIEPVQHSEAYLSLDEMILVNEKKKQENKEKHLQTQAGEKPGSFSRFIALIHSIFHPEKMSSTTDGLSYSALAYSLRHSDLAQDLKRVKEFEGMAMKYSILSALGNEDSIRYKYSPQESRLYLLTLVREIDKESQKVFSKNQPDGSRNIAQIFLDDFGMTSMLQTLNRAVLVMCEKHPTAFDKGGVWELPNTLTTGKSVAMMAINQARQCVQIKEDIKAGSWVAQGDSVNFMMHSKPVDVVAFYIDALLDLNQPNNPRWIQALTNMAYYANMKSQSDYAFGRAINLDKYDTRFDSHNEKGDKYQYFAKIIEKVRNGEINAPVEEVPLKPGEFTVVSNEVLVPKTRRI